MKPKIWMNVRLSQKQAEFLQKYGKGWTEALENALDRLRILEENQNQLKTEQDKKKQQQLDFLKEKELIKTDAFLKRQKAKREKVRVDWGDSESFDSFRLGDGFFEGDA